jgi:hypothetical protein
MNQRPESSSAPLELEDSFERGEVDLSLIKYLLSLTPSQRAEKHYQARLFALKMQGCDRRRAP